RARGNRLRHRRCPRPANFRDPPAGHANTDQEGTPMQTWDVIIVGAGNAALCAALAAQESGGKVLVLERAAEEESGGNSRFTAGLMRIAYNGVDDLRPLIDLSEEEVARSDFGTYTEEQFFD